MSSTSKKKSILSQSGEEFAGKPDESKKKVVLPTALHTFPKSSSISGNESSGEEEEAEKEKMNGEPCETRKKGETRPTHTARSIDQTDGGRTWRCDMCQLPSWTTGPQSHGHHITRRVKNFLCTMCWSGSQEMMLFCFVFFCNCRAIFPTFLKLSKEENIY